MAGESNDVEESTINCSHSAIALNLLIVQVVLLGSFSKEDVECLTLGEFVFI